MNNLASLLKALGSLEEALELHREVLAKERQVLGVQHHSTLTSMNNLASTLQEMGQPEEAEILFRECLASLHSTAGNTHEDNGGQHPRGHHRLHEQPSLLASGKGSVTGSRASVSRKHAGAPREAG